MNMIFSLLPIILIILLVVFAIFLTKRNSKKKKKYLSGQKIRVMFGAYFVVLLISVVLVYLIPNEAEPEVNEPTANRSILHNKVLNGNASIIDRDRIAKQWHFDYEEAELMMKAINNDVHGLSIYIGKKKENDGMIDVLLYQTPTYVQGIDVTDQVKAPLIDLSSGTLGIGKPEQQQLTFTSFSQAFPLSQFTGEDWIGMGGRSTRGEHLLYIRVPRDLNIHFDHYVGAEYVKE